MCQRNLCVKLWPTISKAFSLAFGILSHWIKWKNNTPTNRSNLSPNHIITESPTDLSKSFQFSFGDLLAVKVPKELRPWKFAHGRDLFIFVGQPNDSVESALVYSPFDHNVLTRGDLFKLDISDELLQYYRLPKDRNMVTSCQTTASLVSSFLDVYPIDLDALVTS